MTKLTLSFVLLFLAAQAKSQNFEGEIILTLHFESKMKNLTNEQLSAMMGTRQDYFVKNASYKSLTNGKAIMMQLYNSKTNRIYNKTPKSDTLYWIDAAVNNDSVTSFEIKKNAEKILGYDCDAIIMKTQSGITTMYYNAKFKMDNRLYSNHHFANWAFYLNKARALPLKTIIETARFKTEVVAVEIKPMKLGDSDFNIDPKAPLKKGF